MGLSTICLLPYKMKVNGIPMEFRCGKCYACYEHKFYELLFRAKQEYKLAKSGMFITLTQDENNIQWIECIDKETGEITHNQNLVKEDFDKFRKAITMRHNRALKKHPIEGWPKFKWIGNGELGTKNQRPHYHLLMFNLHPKITEKEIQDIWKKGFITTGAMQGEEAIRYILKDMVKQMEIKKKLHPDMQKPFQKWSNGFGESFINKFGNYIHEDSPTINGQKGVKIGIGKYLMDKAKKSGYIKEEKLTEAETVEKYYQGKEDKMTRIKELESEAYKRFGVQDIETAQNRMKENKELKRKFFGKQTL